MPDRVTSRVEGLPELNRKLAVLRSSFDGPPLTRLCLQGAREIASQAKRNARRGPTGLLQRGILAFAGQKASKWGAAAVARVKWKGTGAIFEEWGTKERVFTVMRIPLSKLGARGTASRGRVGKFGFGFLFIRRAKPMQGTRFFENAVEEKMPVAAKIIEEGSKKLIAEAIR